MLCLTKITRQISAARAALSPLISSWSASKNVFVFDKSCDRETFIILSPAAGPGILSGPFKLSAGKWLTYTQKSAPASNPVLAHTHTHTIFSAEMYFNCVTKHINDTQVFLKKNANCFNLPSVAQHRTPTSYESRINHHNTQLNELEIVNLLLSKF